VLKTYFQDAGIDEDDENSKANKRPLIPNSLGRKRQEASDKDTDP
jgi:hypothetical protein